MTYRIDASKNFPLQDFVCFWISDHINDDIFSIGQNLQQPLNRFYAKLKIPGKIFVAGKAVTDIITQRGDLSIEQLGVRR